MATKPRSADARRVVPSTASPAEAAARVIIRRARLGGASGSGNDIEVEVDGFAVSPFKADLIAQISGALLAVPDDQLRRDSEESAEEAADRFIASRRVRNEWDEAIGPFYETGALVRWLNKKHRMNVQHQIDRREILAVKSGRTLLYPTFQFDPSGQPLPGLPRVLAVLGQYITDPWDQALWLNSPIDGGDGSTAATELRAGRVDDVVRMAQEDVARWSL